MRSGSNPMRRGGRPLLPYKRHRVIIPLYIPQGSDGYYSDALEIFGFCLASLAATADPAQVSVTVINNAAVPEALPIIQRYIEAGLIDRHVQHTLNRGKPDPVIGELHASYEPFITIADADTLFLAGWLNAVERVYREFPAAGCVGPFPAPNLRLWFTTAAWEHAVTRGRLRVGGFADRPGMLRFQDSLGLERPIFSAFDQRTQIAMQRNGTTALLGSGHFVCTMRREVIRRFHHQPAMAGLFHGLRALDEQVDREGYMRLSTPDAFVLHMGNRKEAWMAAELAKLPALPERLDAASLPSARPASRIPYWVRRRILFQAYRLMTRLFEKLNRGTSL